MPWIIAQNTLWYIDQEIATAAAPKLIPVDVVVDLVDDIYISLIRYVNLIWFADK